jgi:hypothetical protein
VANAGRIKDYGAELVKSVSNIIVANGFSGRGRERSTGARLYSQHGASGGQRHPVSHSSISPFREVASAA